MIFFKGTSSLVSFLVLFITTLQLVGAVTLALNDFRGNNDAKLLRGLWGVETVAAVTEDSLTKAAQAAMAVARQRSKKEFQPNALTAMTVDRKTIYYFSAHQGKASPADSSITELGISAPVLAALTACIEKYPGDAAGHGNGAKCGEIMSTNKWFVDTRQTSMAAQSRKLIVTVKADGVVIPPCTSATSGRGTFGCNEYLEQLGWTPAQMIGTADGCGPSAKRWVGRRATKDQANGPVCNIRPPVQPKKKVTTPIKKKKVTSPRPKKVAVPKVKRPVRMPARQKPAGSKRVGAK